MRKLGTNPNVDNSDLSNYPDGRIKDNTGVGDGTAVNERVYGDIHQNAAKLIRLAGINYTNNPDNEENGFQLVEAIKELASKNDYVLELSSVSDVIQVSAKLDYMNVNEQILCKSNFNTSDSQTQIKGIGTTLFNVIKIGDFKENEYVRLIKTNSGILLLRMFDSSNVPDLDTRLADVESKVANVDGKLAIFTVGGAVFIWRKAASLIPPGYQEVTDMRGKTVFGLDPSQIEFSVLNAEIGSKSKTLSLTEIPPHSHKVYGEDNDASPLAPNGEVAQLYNSASNSRNTETVGGGQPFSLLNPARIVNYIEWATV